MEYPTVLRIPRDALGKLRQEEADGQNATDMLHVWKEQVKGYRDVLVSIRRCFPRTCEHLSDTINVVSEVLE